MPAVGWARVAMALQTLQGLPDAVLLVDLADGGLIVVDWGRKDYWWQRAPQAFPLRPTISKIRVYREEGARLPFMLEQPAELSSLLWLVGIHAFPQAPAWWLAEGVSYQLARWPDFTVLAHATEHVSMTALLARRAYSADELAVAADVDPAMAQSFINALSLMGLLRETASAPAAVVEVQAPGLFARLRARLGV